MYFKKLFHPEYFQGNKKRDNYFEGWYYKFVSADETKTIALIPGVSINKEDQHAFIQVFISKKIQDEVDLKTYYIRYAFEAFKYDHETFSVSIGNNTFCKTHVYLDINRVELQLSGTITLSNLTPIEKTIFQPNIMGFFGYLNFMECYHGVISMSHDLKGKMSFNEEMVLFDNAKGYIEKDWGRSFPKAYVWLQSNHFSNTSTSLMFSYADIPFIGRSFKGLIVNLNYENKEYRFATYNGAKVIIEEIEKSTVTYLVKKGIYRIKVTASSDHQINLTSPRNGKMIEQIKEGLSGKIKIQLFKKGSLIYEDTGYHAGIEIMK
jgi:tocopherol cyclase